MENEVLINSKKRQMLRETDHPKFETYAATNY